VAVFPYRGNREAVLKTVRGYVGSVPGLKSEPSEQPISSDEPGVKPLVEKNYFGHQRPKQLHTLDK